MDIMDSALTSKAVNLVCEEFALVEMEPGELNYADQKQHTGQGNCHWGVFGSARVVYRPFVTHRPACADPTVLCNINGTPYPGFLSKKLLLEAKHRVKNLCPCA